VRLRPLLLHRLRPLLLRPLLLHRWFLVSLHVTYRTSAITENVAGKIWIFLKQINICTKCRKKDFIQKVFFILLLKKHCYLHYKRRVAVTIPRRTNRKNYRMPGLSAIQVLSLGSWLLKIILTILTLRMYTLTLPTACKLS